MIIQHNISAVNTNRMLGITNRDIADSAQKLSSGYKVNIAADDAAGLSISEKMRKQIRGLNQASDNVEDAISLCQVVDGALEEMHAMTQRMNELCVKAANGTLSESDRRAIQDEIEQIQSEMTRIIDSTKFNEVYVLTPEPYQKDTTLDEKDINIVYIIDITGSMGGMIGNVVDNLERFTDKLNDRNVKYGVTVYSETGASDYKDARIHPYETDTDVVKDSIAHYKTHLDGGGDHCESALEAIHDAIGSYDIDSNSLTHFILVTDADYHKRDHTPTSSGCNQFTNHRDKDTPGFSCCPYNPDEIADELKANNINMTLVGTPGIYSKYTDYDLVDKCIDINDANFSDQLEMLAGSIKAQAGTAINAPTYLQLGIQCTTETNKMFALHLRDMRIKTLGLDKVDCRTEASATNSISVITVALQRLSHHRSWIGGAQNALEHIDRNVQCTSENTQASESRIRDTDMAKQMVRFSNLNILSSSGNSMLAQANQSKNGILTLLSA